MRCVSRKSITVYPATPTPEEKSILFLSAVDHTVRPRHIPIVLFFAALENGEEVLPLQVLQDSMSKLLAEFYPLAGRLRRKQNGNLELLCNGEGAELVEAVIEGQLSDFGYFQPNKLYTDLLDPLTSQMTMGKSVLDFPVFYAQVSRFSCGGAALVVSIIHTVTDGLSVNQVVTSWSELARGVSLSNPPFHDRTLLQSKVSADPHFQPTSLRVVPSVTDILPQQMQTLGPAEKMFTFSPAQLKKVKAKASSDGERGVFSTFESINAHIWRCITKARCLDAHSKTKFLTTLDARKRLKPNLPDGYFGNAICFVSASATVSEMTSNPLSFAASRIQETITGFTGEYMQSVIAWAEQQKSPMVMNVNAEDSAGHDISVASWVRLSFHVADFGSGKPLIVSPGNNPYDGSIIMLPSHKGEGYMNIFIALSPASMERLEHDPEFLLEI
ncbi:hypothetical protein O6H91_09G027500 [Diphasiastrum complanatum]|uniref:Uncharacterized protein n=1 Tax=Diphasiastrum complanatum TaxID=34168 RepID=A0ACC2CMH3_DIPCM|nr:hypothetical protein O6H91_09G027500 [Diphasiastrum complanatum]